MWVMSTRGFYSAVQKREDQEAGLITVRARVRADLVRLNEILPQKRRIYRETFFTDYEWRMRLPKDEWAFAVEFMASEIDYDNFKDEVKRLQGSERSWVYSDVWQALLRLERIGGKRRRSGGWDTDFGTKPTTKPKKAKGRNRGAGERKFKPGLSDVPDRPHTVIDDLDELAFSDPDECAHEGSWIQSGMGGFYCWRCGQWQEDEPGDYMREAA